MPSLRRVRSVARSLTFTFSALTLAACGGGGGSDGGAPTGPQSVSGTVVDGYLSGAALACARGSGAGNGTTSSSATGTFSFTLPAGQRCESVESHGGVDVGITPADASDDVLRASMLLRAPVPGDGTSVSGLFITPASTIIDALVAGGRSFAEAQDIVRTALGVNPSADLLATDPTADAALYRIDAALAQILEQVAAAIAAGGGVTDEAGTRAIANATIAAVASSMSAGTTLVQLAVAPTSLVPTSPLVALIAQALRNAQADAAVAAQLAAMQPETLSLLAAPLVASNARQVMNAGGVQDVVDASGEIAERGGTAAVIGLLVGVLDDVPTAGQQQALLDAMAAAAQAAEGGTSHSATITVGGASVVVNVPGTTSNFLRLAGDAVRLYATTGSPIDVTVAEFDSAAGATLPNNLSKVGFTLQASADSTQLDEPREVSLAVDVRDTTNTRILQGIVDRVVVFKDAGGVVQANVAAGATVTLYAKSSTAETTSPFVLSLGDTARPITTDSGEVMIALDPLLALVGGRVDSGSPLATLAIDGISGGTFIVTFVVGDLRIAHLSPDDLSPTLGEPLTVRLETGTRAVTGYGVRGRVVIVGG